MQKWIIPSSFTMAIVVSFCLFAFMASLIEPTAKIDTTADLAAPELLFEISEQPPEPPKTRAQPPKMTKATPPPPTQVIEVADQTIKSRPENVLTDIDFGGTIKAGFSHGNDRNPLSKAGQEQPDALATPIIQITPQYPIEQARKGIEGWVKLSFSIDTDGSVTNIQVLDASPKRVFNRAARKALKGWRYKAKFVNSVPVIQHNLQVQLDFELDQ